MRINNRKAFPLWLLWTSILLMFNTACRKKEGPAPDPEPERVPAVTTTAPKNITTESARCGGQVTDVGSTAVTALGVCWDTLPNPTLSGAHTSTVINSTFFCTLSNLQSGRKYFARAYATSNTGTGYGNEVEFTTLKPDYTPLLINRQYILVGLLASPAVNGVTDLLANMQSCVKDNRIGFTEPGFYVVEEGPSSCNASDPYTRLGTWNWDDDQSTLGVNFESKTTIYKVLICNGTTLKLSYVIVQDGVSYTITATYLKNL